MKHPKQSVALPLVSVITPAYNAEKFIERTLESVLNQTYKNIEILVIDDGSQDKTPEIVKSVAHRDHRVILLQQANAGVAAARNLAIEKSRGEFIAPIDADDIWYPQNLEKQVQCLLQSESSVGLVYAWSVDIDEEDLLTGGFHVSDYQGDVYTMLAYRNFIGNASSIVIRRSCLEEIGGYSYDLRAQGAQGCEDLDLYLRIAERYQVRVVPEFLIGYRQVTSSMSRNYTSMAKSHDLVLQAVQQKHPEINAVVYQWSISNFCVYLSYQSNQDGNAKNSLLWLYKALRLDFSMTLIRPDLYILLIKNILTFTKNTLKLRHPDSYITLKEQESARKKTMTDINMRVKIRALFPSIKYERLRMSFLKSRIGKNPIKNI